MIVEYPELAGATIPVSVIQPYLDRVVEQHGMTNAGPFVGIAARRVLGMRDQLAVTPEVADRIVIASAGATAWHDDPLLRRFWWASLPGYTLYLRSHKRNHERARQRREARELVSA